ncbi:unnamed protein product, partial [Sphagnum tenellum]
SGSTKPMSTGKEKTWHCVVKSGDLHGVEGETERMQQQQQQQQWQQQTQLYSLIE